MEIRETVVITQDDGTTPWPISWSAVWAGALAALAATTVFGLYGTAIGIGSAYRIKDFSTWHEVTLIDLAGAIIGVFFAYVIGGWVAGKITGARYSEPTILHGAIAWLVTVPMLVVLLALGAGSTFGGWYGGVVSTIGASQAVQPTAEAIRHSATAAATALLVGLIGSVIGGWMASGEPMSFTHHKTRSNVARRAR